MKIKSIIEPYIKYHEERGLPHYGKNGGNEFLYSSRATIHPKFFLLGKGDFTMKSIFTFLFITIIVTVNVSFSYCDDFQNEIEKLVAISEKAAVFHKDASDMMLGLNNTKKAMEYSEFFTEVVVPFRNEIEWLIDLAKIKQCIKWEDVNKKIYYMYILTHRIKEVEEDVGFRIKITNILLANTTIPNLLRLMEKFKENIRNSLSVLNTLADVKDVGSSR